MKRGYEDYQNYHGYSRSRMSGNGEGSGVGDRDRERSRDRGGRDHSRSRDDRRDHSRSRDDRRDHSRSRDDRRDHSRSRNDRRDHSRSRNDRRDHSRSRDDRREHSRSRDDRREHSRDPGGVRRASQHEEGRERPYGGNGYQSNNGGRPRYGGGDGPQWENGRPPAGRARAAPPPTSGFPPMPAGEDFTARGQSFAGNGDNTSENGDGGAKRRRADGGGDGNGGEPSSSRRDSVSSASEAGSSAGRGFGRVDVGERSRGDVGERGRGYGGERGRGHGGERGRGHGGERGRVGRGGRGARGGGGRGEGRGARRGRREEDYDLVVTRPTEEDGTALKKQAALVNGNKPAKLMGNFFRVAHRPHWCIYHYRVDFQPDEADTRIKKKLLKDHEPILGAYIFDGSSLYVSDRLHPDPMQLISVRLSDQARLELTIRLVGELAPTDVMYLQFFNIIVRKCLESMELEEMGRNFYDRRQAVRIEAHHLELWPGYKTSMRNHEQDILLGVEITHKVLRLDNCLQVMSNMRGRVDDPQHTKDELVGTIVMTIYNRKTYRVDDIDYDKTPLSTFDMRGKEITFMDYFKEKYGLTIGDPHQPMLVSRPKKRDLHRGMTGIILLIPELCQMTGLTDQMRQNNQLMRALATHLHTDPMRRVQKLNDFMQRLQRKPDIQEELQRWGLSFNERLVEFQGHTIPNERILFGNQMHEVPNDRYDWGQAFRGKPMLSSVSLQTWVIIVNSRDANVVDKLVNNMQRVSRPLCFNISSPAETRRVTDARPNDYAKAVDSVMNEYKNRLQMIFVILPRHATDIYTAVKKRACIEFGVPSQCFVAKNAHNDKGLMSICTKVVVQMNAKLGGEPWSIPIPLKKLMIVGFDVYHCGKRRGSSVGAMVATTSSSQAKYFSTVSYHSGRDELSEKMGADFTKCLHAFQKINHELPDRIIMYRDGVGDGQLKYVFETELVKIQEAMTSVYAGAGRQVPRFSFIVVTKRINTRMFSMDNHRPVNPGPGTVADDVITLPERYDFYLVSQHSRQGTVSPVSYNVLYDRQGLDADKMQRLTFKLCHLYFNWSGTVTVPAPCQYAHKLAYLTGLALGGPSHERLSNLLYYL